jgi:hypothetical protein
MEICTAIHGEEDVGDNAVRTAFLAKLTFVDVYIFFQERNDVRGQALEWNNNIVHFLFKQLTKIQVADVDAAFLTWSFAAASGGLVTKVLPEIKGVTWIENARVGAAITVIGVTWIENARVGTAITVAGVTWIETARVGAAITVAGVSWIENARVGAAITVIGVTWIENARVGAAITVTGVSWIENARVGAAIMVAGVSWIAVPRPWPGVTLPQTRTLVFPWTQATRHRAILFSPRKAATSSQWGDEISSVWWEVAGL